MKCFLAILCLTTAAFAGTLVTRDGKTLTGDIALDSGKIVIQSKDGATTFTPDQIASLDFAAIKLPTPQSTEAPKRIKRKTPLGVLVEYFAKNEFKERKFAYYDHQVTIHSATAAPPDDLPPGLYAGRCTARIVPSTSEPYTFRMEATGPARLWIDGKLVIDAWESKRKAQHTGTIDLAAKKPVSLKLETLASAGELWAKLMWTTPTNSNPWIPTDAFLPPEGLTGTPPVVDIVSPADLTPFVSAGEIVFDVSASDADGRVESVDLFVGREKVASATKAPYRLTWKDPPNGHHRIVARATDDKGLSAYSAEVELPVGDSGEKASLPKPWGAQTIFERRDKGLPGTASFDSGAFIITRGGGQFTEGDDAAHFVYQPVTGDFEVIAQLKSLKPADGFVGPLAGLMVRQTMARGAKVSAVLASEKNLFFANRPESHNKVGTVQKDHTGPVWMKVLRHAHRLRAYTSTDGKTWALLGVDKVDFGDTAYVGLCAMSRDVQSPATVVFDQVSITPGPPALAHTAPGILFKNGEFLAADVASVKESKIVFTRDGKRQQLPVDQVARLIYNPVPSELAEQVNTNNTGVLLASGDFIEGELREITYYVSVSNVVFGLRKFNTKGKDVLAIYMADMEPAKPAAKVTLADGSVLYCNSITINREGLGTEGSVLGKIDITLKDLAKIEWNAANR